MLPIFKPLDVAIFDSKGNAVRKFEQAEFDSTFGVYEESLEIADEPNLGKWKIQVEVDGRKVSKNFEVQKFDRGDIEVLIDAPPVIAHVDKFLYFKIITKAHGENFMTGSAKISVSARFVGSNRVEVEKKSLKTVDLKADGKTQVRLDLKEDLDINFPSSDMVLTLEVDVTNRATQISKKVSKEIKMMHSGKNTFQIVRKRYFKPGFKYPMKIRVKLLDGKPDNSFNQLSMQEQLKKGQETVENKSYKIDLKSGETTQFLEPANDITQIVVNFEFANTKQTEVIDAFPTFGANEYMQATVTSKK